MSFTTAQSGANEELPPNMVDSGNARRAAFQEATDKHETDIDEENRIRRRRISVDETEEVDEENRHKLGNQTEQEAIHRLLKHVKMDPDGGILNLVEGGKQRSKVPALQKNTLETAQALVAVLRTVATPAAMIYLSFRMVHRQTFTTDGFDHLKNELHRLRLGNETAFIGGKLVYVFIGGNLMEFFLAVGCILLALYRVLMIFYHKAREGTSEVHRDGSDVQLIESEEVVNPRYMHEADFWLINLPRLQNLSLFRLLAYAHPVLLDKNWKRFTRENEMSRAILESFFKCKGQYKTDEELVEKVAILITQSDLSLAGSGDQNDRSLASSGIRPEEVLYLNTRKTLNLLRTYNKTPGRLKFDEKHNPQALDRLMRLDLLVFGEKICFGMLVIICLLLGALEFFHKICRCSLMLTDKDAVAWYWCLMYFALFLNQTIGMMHVGLLLRSRVETFIFGGTDAMVSCEEHYVMRVYLGLLVERIWDLQANVFQKLAIMMALDDDDLQQLVVEESESKAAVAAKIRNFMDQRRLSSTMSAAMKHVVAG